MEKRKEVSGWFIVIMIVFVLGTAAYCYMNEQRSIENSVAITAKIVGAKNMPRKRILQLETIDERISGSTLFVTVPFWDPKKEGEKIRVRIDPETASLVGVDAFVYLHKMSLGILAGCSLLFVILSGVFIFRKKNAGVE